MSVSTILRSVSGRPPKTVHEELRDLETRLEIQLDRVVQANSVLRRFIEENGQMDEFLAWQAMSWRDGRH